MQDTAERGARTMINSECPSQGSGVIIIWLDPLRIRLAWPESRVLFNPRQRWRQQPSEHLKFNDFLVMTFAKRKSLAKLESALILVLIYLAQNHIGLELHILDRLQPRVLSLTFPKSKNPGAERDPHRSGTDWWQTPGSSPFCEMQTNR